MFVRRPVMSNFSRMAAVLGVLLVLPLLAGCLNGTPETADEGPRAAIRVDGDLPCDPDVISNCDELAQDPAAAMIVSGIHLVSGNAEHAVGTDPEEAKKALRADTEIGILVTNINRDLVLQDLHVEGYETGVLLEQIDCPQCEITIKDLTIKESGRTYATEDGATFFSPVTGIHIENVTADITIHKANIDLPGGGWVHYEAGSFSIQIFPSAHGIWVEGYSGDLIINRLELHAESQAAGWGIVIQGKEIRATIMDSMITNFGTCLMTRALNVVVENVSMEGCITGARFQGAPFDDEPATTKVDQILVMDSRWFGVVVEQSDYNVCTMRPPTPERLDPEFNFTMSNSVIENSGLVGLYIRFSSAYIEQSQFTGNGHNFEPGASPADEISTGGVSNRCGITTVQQSVFAENNIFGYRGHEWDDATNNWWGSPLGPSIQDEFLLLPQLTGDSITPQVRYMPFLAEEPGP